MTIDELRKAYETDEVLEYHITGEEIDPGNLLSTPGWYPCTVNWVPDHRGGVEITVTRPDGREIDVTVLRRNIPIAFRKKQEQAV